jgi:hypothetical protein
MRIRGSEFLCPVGAVCPEEELTETLKHAKVIKYRIKKIDDDPIPDWENAGWTSIE